MHGTTMKKIQDYTRLGCDGMWFGRQAQCTSACEIFLTLFLGENIFTHIFTHLTTKLANKSGTSSSFATHKWYGGTFLASFD
jgi:hypothetical protein